MSKLHAVGVGNCFNLFEEEEIKQISLKSSNQEVLVDGEIYELQVGTSFVESQKIDDLLDQFGELITVHYNIATDKKEEYIAKVLEGNFKFNKWDSFRKAPVLFEGKLADFDVNQFGDFGVYSNFEESLRDNFDLQGDGVEDWQLKEVFSDKAIFEEFKNSYLIYMDEKNSIQFEDINEPILIGQIKSVDGWWVEHFKPIHEVQGIGDIKGFINDVLKDQGQETHFSGLKNTIEVDKSEFEVGYETRRTINLKNDRER